MGNGLDVLISSGATQPSIQRVEAVKPTTYPHLLPSSLTNSLASIMQTKRFILKYHMQSHLKFINVIIIAFSVFCNMFRPHKAVIWQALMDRNQCVGSHVNIITCYYFTSSYSRMYALTFLMLLSCCGVRAVLL
jgi:hypothetical protein